MPAFEKSFLFPNSANETLKHIFNNQEGGRKYQVFESIYTRELIIFQLPLILIDFNFNYPMKGWTYLGYFDESICSSCKVFGPIIPFTVTYLLNRVQGSYRGVSVHPSHPQTIIINNIDNISCQGFTVIKFTTKELF